MNSFGENFRVSIFGESHGGGLGIVVDGVPPGIALAAEDFMPDIDRRRSGAKGTTPRKESDLPEILSGLFEGHTTGAPLAVLFRNENTRSGDYSNLVEHPRPGHADFVMQRKYGGFADYRGGGHFSGRVTLGLVAAGVVAKKMLAAAGVAVNAEIEEIAGESDPEAVRRAVEEAVRAKDSCGGIVRCRATGMPVGLGEPFFDSVESLISHLVFSIPAVRGIEFGEGFAAARRSGSEHNDLLTDAEGHTATNHSGGVNGGITNGNDLFFRVAVKPTSSISRVQETYHFGHGRVEELVVRGRHDACIALRVPVVVEAAAAIVLADLLKRRRASEIR